MAMRRPARRSAPSRKLIWARSDHLGLIVNEGIAFDLLADYRAQGGNTLGATVTRVRLDFDVFMPEGAGATEGFGVYAGVIVDQRQADELEVPRPTIPNEPHADWMYWRQHYLTHSHSVIVTGGQPLASYEVDIRAQRKMEELQETLWFVAAQSPALALLEGETNITASASVLLKLP